MHTWVPARILVGPQRSSLRGPLPSSGEKHLLFNLRFLCTVIKVQLESTETELENPWVKFTNGEERGFPVRMRAGTNGMPGK